ncbi:hypothetical protein Cgig2_016390 [Carnegiea gigantea]|uniref:Uncharacterized protein n=1 Tax=Carnegiea gigantea TaxID=171969 RepID=A0A9Q1QEC2_9CARY|nr:hypothetical protein Cgig2_016390 [Carnegiea gigantea]
MVFLDFLSTEQAANYIKETFKWHLRRVARPPRLPPENYHDLCLYFDLDMAEVAARDLCIHEITQAVFYAMVVSKALELGVMSRDLAEHLKPSLEGLQEAACDFDILEMIQATCYAMAVNDALELGIISRDMAGALKSALEANRGVGPAPANDQEKTLGSSDAPPPSSDEEWS